MNDEAVASKFISWALTGIISIVCVIGFKPLTFALAKAAFEAQQHPMSYGKFSRQLWSTHKKHK